MRYSGRWGIRVSGGEGRCARGVQAENGGAGQKARACWRWLHHRRGQAAGWTSGGGWKRGDAKDNTARVRVAGGQRRACACDGSEQYCDDSFSGRYTYPGQRVRGHCTFAAGEAKPRDRIVCTSRTRADPSGYQRESDRRHRTAPMGVTRSPGARGGRAGFRRCAECGAERNLLRLTSAVSKRKAMQSGAPTRASAYFTQLMMFAMYGCGDISSVRRRGEGKRVRNVAE